MDSAKIEEIIKRKQKEMCCMCGRAAAFIFIPTGEKLCFVHKKTNDEAVLAKGLSLSGIYESIGHSIQ